MASTRSLIKVALDLATKITRDILFGVADVLTSLCQIPQSTKPFALFAFKLQQYFLGQRIRQTKRHEVGGAFPLDVWQIAACVNARAERAGRLVSHSAYAELMARALQAGIRLG